ERMRRIFAAVGAGLAGAGLIALLNRLGPKLYERAPRTDLLRERILRRVSGRRLNARQRHRIAVFGDALSNTILFSTLFAGRPRPWLRGPIGGTLAGLAAGILPRTLGLERRRNVPSLPLMLAWYLGGGLASSAFYRALTAGSSRAETMSVPRHAL